MAGWPGEEGEELEEEEVEEEEEEESGNLDEEEIKKMQSDEVCRQPQAPSAVSTAEPPGVGVGHLPGFCTALPSPLQGTAGLEVTAYKEMSSLVNYIQPTKFISFELSASE